MNEEDLQAAIEHAIITERARCVRIALIPNMSQADIARAINRADFDGFIPKDPVLDSVAAKK